MTTAATCAAERVTVVWFPDWPVYALGRSLGWDVFHPAAVIADHRVLACNAAARKAGVRTGMKQRHALATCPRLAVAEDDPAQQAAVHEDVVTALADVAAGVETLRPGLLAFATDPLARYYGGEDTAVELLLNAAVRLEADCQVGTADDLVTAIWAARAGRVIEPGGAKKFVSRLPINALTSDPALHGPTELVDVLQQLGVQTLADFAALPRTQVAARFGQNAVEWHRIAAGELGRGVAPQRNTEALVVRHELDEPIANTQTAAFVAKRAAALLHNELFKAGDACLRLSVRAYINPPPGYTGATVVERAWRCREPLTEEETAQRVRWQLDGWITRLRSRQADPHRGNPQSSWEVGEWSDGITGVSAIELIPIDTVPAGTVVAPLWGGPDEGIRAARAVAGRAQALIGTQGVRRAIHRGGRAVAGRIVTVAYGDEDPEEVTALQTTAWEGQLLAPLPALVGAPPRDRGNGNPIANPAIANPSIAHPAARVSLLDAAGTRVYVTGRGLISAPPEELVWGHQHYRITGWAGPWPVDEQWWARGKRYARAQISTDEPGAYLLVCKGSHWRIEATY
ncbi:Y-family DNA polymerase [Corynebacterium heidelbergense]|uniref:DNA polymerase n=1 Tax=Corynebacterium heidelbergense TaxID=2055947 RepID=A0A364VA63_9CORY|nr:DNA polymerase Y family protein [Corynebacterium heidelbergense]RAV33456.1 DNA polymerase [Corynebacterium heidelbergense]WCZ37269.1 DNA polymerase IV [Corynebacterium heidelbergense]